MSAFKLEKSRVIAAPLPAVWEVVSNVGRYHEVVDGLTWTEITSGAGEGMVRHCVDTRAREWQEECTLWEPSVRYRMTVDIDSYPASFRAIFRSLEGSASPARPGWARWARLPWPRWGATQCLTRYSMATRASCGIPSGRRR